MYSMLYFCVVSKSNLTFILFCSIKSLFGFQVTRAQNLITKEKTQKTHKKSLKWMQVPFLEIGQEMRQCGNNANSKESKLEENHSSF